MARYRGNQEVIYRRPLPDADDEGRPGALETCVPGTMAVLVRNDGALAQGDGGAAPTARRMYPLPDGAHDDAGQRKPLRWERDPRGKRAKRVTMHLPGRIVNGWPMQRQVEPDEVGAHLAEGWRRGTGRTFRPRDKEPKEKPETMRERVERDLALLRSIIERK